MLSYTVLLTAFFALITQIRLRGRGRAPSRRILSGFEVARLFLDREGAGHVSIEPVSGFKLFRRAPLKQFFLERALYEGRTLLDHARAARESVAMTRAQHMIFSFDFSRRLWLWLKVLALLGWLASLLSHPGFLPAGEKFALGAFFVLFLAALFELPLEWETSQRAYGLLKESGYFEIDELVQMRRILKGLRFEKLALIFKAPFDLAGILIHGFQRPESVHHRTS